VGDLDGTMLWFHEGRGSGFVLSANGERLAVDREAFVEAAPVGRCAGLPVRFTVREHDGMRVATEVSVIETDQPRRARRRGRSGGF
jgi:cold shock CspA family protein